jgi:flagellar motor switch protein FliM
VDDEVIVTVEGLEKFRAIEGTLRGRRAFRIGRPAIDAADAVDATKSRGLSKTEPPATPTEGES